MKQKEICSSVEFYFKTQKKEFKLLMVLTETW